MEQINVEVIKQNFSKVISYSQGINNPRIDELFDRWYVAKSKFIQKFGGLIYEHPKKFTFPLDERHKEEKICKFIEEIEQTYNNPDLSNFIMLNQKTFFENKVEVNMPFADKGVKKGMKLVKAFKFFEEDKEVLDRLQSKASQIIQEDKIEGTLCFSVHPLDYLSISCNNYNWRSCHALDGEYRAGNLSYMVDESTIICYVKGEGNVNIPLFPEDVPWNSKKWRVLLYFAEDYEYIFAGKPYPFNSYEGLEQMRKVLCQLFNFNEEDWCPWTNPIGERIYDDQNREYSLKENYIWMRGSFLPLSTYVKDEEYSLHFNDVLRSSSYLPYYTAPFNWSYMPPYEHCIYVGGTVKCLHCGDRIIEETDTMLCPECSYEDDNAYYCEVCGCKILPEDEAHWMTDDTAVCDRCYHDSCFECADCHEIYFNYDKRYHRKTQEDLCQWCYDRRHEEE